MADAHHTLSDLLTSVTVIVALIGVWLGYGWLDPLPRWSSRVHRLRVLGDFRVDVGNPRRSHRDARKGIREVVCGVPEVMGCHHIRTRGTADLVFLDLHVWMEPAMPLEDAHALSHEVKDRLMARSRKSRTRSSTSNRHRKMQKM